MSVSTSAWQSVESREELMKDYQINFDFFVDFFDTCYVHFKYRYHLNIGG